MTTGGELPKEDDAGSIVTAEPGPSPPSPNILPGGNTDLDVAIEKVRQVEQEGAATPKLGQALGDLETMTWRATRPPVLNLQVILRRKYEASIAAAEATGKAADAVASHAKCTLILASGLATVGWLLAVVCVLAGVFRHDGSPSIHDLWPMLLATSGAVLLLIGIATLTFRYSQRSHDRGMQHYDEARQTRRLETAVRLLMMLDDKGTETRAGRALRDSAFKLLDAPLPEKVPHVEISATPEQAAETIGKAIDGVTSVAKAAIGVIKKD